MKSKEELNALKEEVEAVSKKTVELTEEELAQVSGGIDIPQSSEALRTLNNALQRALNQEASIGAARNPLKFTGNNLMPSSENLQSAERTWNDADMAKEMAEFTKEKIMQEAMNSMHSQENQKIEGMLSMLQ